MRTSKLILLIIGFLHLKAAGIAIPDDIEVGFEKGRTGESGGLFLEDVDRERFIGYVCENWREITDHIESLPRAKGSFGTKDGAFDCSVNTFATACEWLPPEEYVDFLNKLADLYEQERIGYLAVKFQLGGNAKKDSFLAVNWHHPSVNAFLQRMKTLVPDQKDVDWIEGVLRGDHEDSYMVNKSDDAPLPETLPGVKLKRPFASIIPRFERLTGKKVPPDPRFPEDDSSRPPRRPGSGDSDSPTESVLPSRLPGDAKAWSIASFSAAALLLAALLLLRESRRRSDS